MTLLLLLATIIVALFLFFRLRKGAPVSPDDMGAPPGLPVLVPAGGSELLRCINEQYHKKATYYRATLRSGQDVAIGATPGDSWLDVIARRRKSGEKDGVYTGTYAQFGFELEGARWSYGDGPPGAREIRQILTEHFGAPDKIGRYLGGAISADPVVDQVSPARDSLRSLLQRPSGGGAIADSLERTPACFVCKTSIDVPTSATKGDRFSCLKCSTSHVLVQSGSLVRPERLAIYIKYDGDYGDRNDRGLIGELESECDQEFEDTRKRRKARELNEKEYKRLYGQWSRRKQARISELSAEKEGLLAQLRKEEAAIRKRVAPDDHK